MDMNLIKPFLAVYDLNSITKAAELLDITQPSMSASIKRLEHTLGYALFTRVGRRIEPTPEAHHLAIHFRKAIDEVGVALQTNKEIVCTTPESVLLKIPDIKNVHFIESALVDYETLDKLRLGKVDICIDAIEVNDPSFVVEHVFDMCVVFMCRKDHPVVDDELTIEMFNELEHITLKTREQGVTALELLTEKKIKRKVIRQVNSPSNVLLSLINSDAICASSETMIEFGEMLGLKVVRAPFDTKPFRMNMIYHKRNARDKHHKQIRQQIKEYLSRS